MFSIAVKRLFTKLCFLTQKRLPAESVLYPIVNLLPTTVITRLTGVFSGGQPSPDNKGARRAGWSLPKQACGLRSKLLYKPQPPPPAVRNTAPQTIHNSGKNAVEQPFYGQNRYIYTIFLKNRAWTNAEAFCSAPFFIYARPVRNG